MILACHNIAKSFGEQVIVKSGSFHIEDREKVALIGLNGAGKSTFLKAILGQREYDGIIAFSEPGQRSRKPRMPPMQ